MKVEEFDLDKLEKIRFEIEEEAFRPKVLHCSHCHIKMRKTEVEVQVDKQIYLKLEGFECYKCKKKYLGLEEAQKLDKAMIFSRALNRNFKIERSLSFDGDNYTLRIPREFTHRVSKRKIEITPIGAREFCAVVR